MPSGTRKSGRQPIQRPGSHTPLAHRINAGSITGILRSRDGSVWTLITGTQWVAGGVIGNGTTLFSSSFGGCSEHGNDLQFYDTSPESDGRTWSPMMAPGMTQGGMSVGYDRPHHLYYSSNCRQGFWRVVTP